MWPSKQSFKIEKVAIAVLETFTTLVAHLIFDLIGIKISDIQLRNLVKVSVKNCLMLPVGSHFPLATVAFTLQLILLAFFQPFSRLILVLNRKIPIKCF